MIKENVELVHKEGINTSFIQRPKPSQNFQFVVDVIYMTKKDDILITCDEIMNLCNGVQDF